MCERGWTNADETRLMNIENKTTASTQSRKLRVFFSDVNNPQKFARMAYRDVSQLTWSFNVYQVPYVTLVTAIALLLNVFARIDQFLDWFYEVSWPNLFEVMAKLIWSHDQTYLKSLPEENLEINDEVLWYLIDPIKNHWLLSEVSL